MRDDGREPVDEVDPVGFLAAATGSHGITSATAVQIAPAISPIAMS